MQNPKNIKGNHDHRMEEKHPIPLSKGKINTNIQTIVHKTLYRKLNSKQILGGELRCSDWARRSFSASINHRVHVAHNKRNSDDSRIRWYWEGRGFISVVV